MKGLHRNARFIRNKLKLFMRVYDATLPLSAAGVGYWNLKFTSFGTSGNSIIESLFGQIILIMGQKVYDMHNSAELFYDRGWISSR